MQKRKSEMSYNLLQMWRYRNEILKLMSFNIDTKVCIEFQIVNAFD